MKKTLIRSVAAFAVAASSFSVVSCVNDLDREPFNELTTEVVYQDPANYKRLLAKLYAGLAITGQTGATGQPDLTLIDEGFSSYLRQYWQLQELTTDEAVIAWTDPTLPDLHNMTWTSGNSFIQAMYNRIFYQVTICNSFIRETTDEKLAQRNITGTDLTNAKQYRAEARFLRALSYYHALDMFGNVPFVTESDPVGKFQPVQTDRAKLFAYLESELVALGADNSDLAAPRQNEYARADRAAAWMLLAKLYLNARVYIGQDKYTETITYCNKILNAGYSLSPQYRLLFLADNHTSPEIIFPITSDGLFTKTYGAMTYLVHAPVGGKMNAADFGINDGWGGVRTTRNIVTLMPDTVPGSGKIDQRAVFFKKGQNLEINSLTTFTDGYAVAKYRNVTSAGTKGTDAEGNFPDTDFPMFRLADVHLMYAEAVERGGAGGDRTRALSLLNALRQRAYGNTSGNITSFNADYILQERARELLWEGSRRTDLIRFGRFTTGTYLWPWKGGVRDGKAVSDNLNVFPIPATDLVANPSLKQNTGY